MASPKLRFKEFDGEWSKSSILDLSKEKALNNGVFNDQNKVGKGYKLINVLDMYIERDIDEARLSLLDLDAKEFERNKVKYGDIFFTRSSLVKEGIAFSNVYLGNSNDITYDGHLIKLSPDLERIDPLFLNFSLKTSNVRKQLIQGGKTATMTTIGQKEVGNCQLDIPSKEEQTKIATFLSAVDEKISQLTQKHQLLSQYKQGMMQKLFSQQIRFKADDGSEFGEWEETELGKHCQIKTGKLDANAMRPNGEFRFYTCAKEFYLIDEYAFDTEALLISGNGANVGYIHYYKGKFNAYQRTYVLDQWQQNIIFIQYFLEQFLKERIYGEKKEGNTPYIVLSTLSEMPLLLPCLEEQTKIAKFLSAIDQKIEVVAQQIEQAKTWKKGLLQQMFV